MGDLASDIRQCSLVSEARCRLRVELGGLVFRASFYLDLTEKGPESC